MVEKGASVAPAKVSLEITSMMLNATLGSEQKIGHKPNEDAIGDKPADPR